MLTRNTDADSYDVPFSLKGVPVTTSFVGRNAQLDRINESLQPSSKDRKRRSMFIVCGLGGIGKTQLVVECAVNISTATVEPSGWIGFRVIDFGIIDNVDLEYEGPSKDEQGYDPRGFIPDADLKTTRFAGWNGWETASVSGTSMTAKRRRYCKALTRSSSKFCNSPYGQATNTGLRGTRRTNSREDVDLLLHKLNPLALKQAGAYVERTGIDVSTYIRHFDGMWCDLICIQDHVLLQEYA
ncbi:hypothetical protein LTS10_011661 [Elasticomyces elasticus]|nr:hypothetical protein LTS10_011661 [Elasticomyces elasticus]